MAPTNPQRWHEIESLYHAAVEASSAERAALLSRADLEVRHAVEVLLSHENDDALLDRPAWELLSVPSEPAVEQLEPGALLGPYRVDAWIGSGGMGDVYRATDARLNRVVAIKVASGRLSARFDREARAIAALNHPNICQIYDIGPNYLVMEHVVGTPVVAVERGAMSLDEALPLALQMAAAIEAAHAKGVVHRDLKPANILVTAEGTVKLLDFGIAKQSPLTGLQGVGVETADFTHVGLIVGTPAYMSPEQADGRPADQRSDLFAFGAILYEMLAGRRAFPGATLASTLGAVLHRPPDDFPTTPSLAAIVARCLAKSPDERFQTAGDLRLALELAMSGGKAASHASRARWRHRPFALATAVLLAAAGIGGYVWQRTKVASINALAVLPLDIQSSDPDADYIADGIAESINDRLSRVPGLRVIPNSIAAQYKGQAAQFQKIGTALGIDAVLSGRAIQRGDELTVSMELSDVHRGTQLWGQRYTRKVADLLSMQNDISREVSQRLRSHLSAQDQRRIEMGATSNPEAYQLYLKGEWHTAKFTRAGFAKGIEYLNQAIALDPDYAQAYSALAYNYINQDDWFMAPADSAPLARTAALKALSLEETDSQAHVVLGIENHWYEWDWIASEREFLRSIELDPDNGDAHGYYSWLLPTLGRNDEALEQARLLTRAFPLSTGGNANLGSVLVFTHRWDEAIAQCQAAIELNPDYWFDYYFLGRAYEQKGQLDQAIEAFQKGLKLEGNTELWGGLGHAYALAGRREDAQQVLRQLDEIAKERYVAPYNVALVHFGLGDRDAGFSWLERAFEARSYLLAVYMNTDARLSNLYVDPRYQSLHNRMRLPTVN